MAITTGVATYGTAAAAAGGTGATASTGATVAGSTAAGGTAAKVGLGTKLGSLSKTLLAAFSLYGAAKELGAVINRGSKYGYGEDGDTARIYNNVIYQRALSDYKMKVMDTYGVDTYKYLNENNGFKVQDIIDKAVEQGYVSKDDAKLAKDYYTFYENNNGEEDGKLSNIWRAGKRLWSWDDDRLGTVEELNAIQRVAEGCAKVAFPNAVNVDEFLDRVYNTGSIPSPEYLSEINPKTDQLPVPEAKWYTGQEMADLFDINYDPNYYYDLIKKGTEASVEAQRYQNDQAIAASMLDDAVSRNQYLQSIDNSKADAVIKGATLGQRMANELLINANAANEYNTNQADVFNQAYTNIQNAINKNAQAGLTAANYYNKNVFQPIGTNIEDLYYNDINRIGAIENYNANIYAANQAYNAAAVQANAEMNAAYNSAVGQINSARNDYRRVYDAYFNSNENPYKGKDEKLQGLHAFNQANAYFLRNNPNAEVK